MSVKEDGETPPGELQLSWSVVGEVRRDSENAAEVEIFKAIDGDTLNELDYEIGCCPRSFNKKLKANWIGEASMKHVCVCVCR